jgi:hypothetical protein
MPRSLLEQLPDIVAQGRRQAEKILEGTEGQQRMISKCECSSALCKRIKS